eukprot:UN00430
MTRGTSSFGKRHLKTHSMCPRCGKHSYHTQSKTCGSCAYPQAKIRQYAQHLKAQRRRTTGTGRMRYMKTLSRKFKNGFRQGTVATKA